ncbi:MAG: hypothetical protein ABEJ79_01190 [Halolamina sp.]
MADLSNLPGERRDRGQLVLVTALVIAVVLVALVLLVNAAIYTENLATRDPSVGADDALAYRETVVDGVGGIVARENRAEYDDRTALEENVTAGVERLDGAVLNASLDSGVSAAVNQSTLSYADGRLIRQTTSSRNFTDASGLQADWTLATDVVGTRTYEATVEPTVQTNASNAPGDAFGVVVGDNDTADTWEAYVYENQSTGDVALAVKNGSDSAPTEVCTTTDSRVTVGLTDGSFAGEPCAALSWATGVDSGYNLTYVNGDAAVGTYNVTIRTEGAGVIETVNMNDGTLTDAPDSPYYVPAVYAAEATVAYDAPELTVEWTVRVAPGEPDA